jgi:heme oxygenase (biliverdin-IX-beta and delta-forming)
LNFPANFRLPSIVIQLRSATEELHRRIETKLGIIDRFSDPARRPELIRRYASLHIPADGALQPFLGDVEGLHFAERTRTRLLAPFVGESSLPAFPAPAGRAAALGMLYVLEGATLGGRLIIRTLTNRGVDDPSLAFLDPYGAQTGSRWRSFLSVLSREIDDDLLLTAECCQGARSAFLHSERVLCDTGL